MALSFLLMLVREEHLEMHGICLRLRGFVWQLRHVDPGPHWRCTAAQCSIAVAHPNAAEEYMIDIGMP